MENVNWLKLKLNKKMLDLQAAKANINADLSSGAKDAQSLVKNTQNKIIQQYQQQFVNPQQLRMNNLASIDRAVYVKNLLSLPKNMVELLVMVQNGGKMPTLNPQQPLLQQPVAQPQQQVAQQPPAAQPNVPPQQGLPQPPTAQPNVPPQQALPQPPTAQPNVPPQQGLPQPPAAQPNVPPQQGLPQPPAAQPNVPPQQALPQPPAAQPNVPPQQALPQPPTAQPNVPPQQGSPQQPVIQPNILPQQQAGMPNVPIKPEQFIHNTKNNIKKQSILSPHDQLHNAVRNNIRTGIILNPQTAQELQLTQQLQAINQKTQGLTPEQLAQFKQNLAAQLNENVNLTSVSALLQKNSKMAMNKMVSMMTMATAQGMTDVKPLQDTINIINSSVAATSQNDATQTLKNLMLLYLPWLPLQEGVGFDLEIEQDEDMPHSDTFIKILITMVNYGNLHATVSLVSGNSVDISIICSEKFPKKELFKRLYKDSTQHSMQTVIDFKEQKPQEQLDTLNPKAKVNLSNVNQVNPYLLLMSHAIIRHTIELDATISIGEQPIDD